MNVRLIPRAFVLIAVLTSSDFGVELEAGWVRTKELQASDVLHTAANPVDVSEM